MPPQIRIEKNTGKSYRIPSFTPETGSKKRYPWSGRYTTDFFNADMEMMDYADTNTDAQRLFFWCYSCWIFLISILLSLFSKEQAFFLINHFRLGVLDMICTVATCMGQGLFVMSVILLYIFIKQRKTAWTVLASFVVSGLLCIILKNVFHEMRPACYFSGSRLVMGVRWIPFSKYHSFPSGHSTTAFAIAMTISQSTSKKWLASLCFCLACLVGYSRVYLGQHFVGDILVGSLIGGISGYFCARKKDCPFVASGLGLEFLYRIITLHNRTTDKLL